jgi:hypothetical protein
MSKVTIEKPTSAGPHNNEPDEVETATIIAGDETRSCSPIQAHAQPNLIKSIFLIAACSAAMVVNVCVWTRKYMFYLH